MAASYASRVSDTNPPPDASAPPAADAAIDAPAANAAGLVARLLGDAMPRLQPGEVWLTGAGPGGIGHLTLYGLAGLVQADVVVYDALVDEAVLGLAPAAARREFAGKRGGRPSIRQNDITARLVTLAREGHRVLRLKGGDPFVFGRGGEEALGLVEASIPFRIIPGLTSGLAGLTAAAIPATMRGINQAVILATGHAAEEAHGEARSAETLDWQAVARLGQPVVLYMATRTIGTISRALMQGGLQADTPAAVLSQVGTPRNSVAVLTLASLERHFAEGLAETPALVVIGGIVTLRETLLTWLGRAGSAF